MSATLVVVGGVACWVAALALALTLCRAAKLGDEQMYRATGETRTGKPRSHTPRKANR